VTSVASPKGRTTRRTQAVESEDLFWGHGHAKDPGEEALVLIEDPTQREAALQALWEHQKPLLVGQALLWAVDQGKIPLEFIQGWVEGYLARRG
jgi:hypothetical protein